MKHKIFIFALLAGLGLTSIGVVSADAAAAPPALSVFTSANKINTEQTVLLTAMASSRLGEAASNITINAGGTKQTCENAYYCQLTAGPFEKKGNVKYTVEAKMKLANGKETRTVKKGAIVVAPAPAVIKNKVATPVALSVFTSTNKIDTQQTVDLTALASTQIGEAVSSITIDVGGNKQTCENAYYCQLTAGPFEKKGNVKYTVEAKLRLATAKNGVVSTKEVRVVKKGVITVVVAKKAAVAKVPVAEKPVTSNAGGSQSGASASNTSGANYKGPFPAPEGMVLTGTTGEDKFQNPTGKGTYRFRIQTSWKQEIACLDETRTIVGSKGKTWEEGYWKGAAIGEIVKEALIVKYDDTPQGAKAGSALYNEGYKMGYAVGFAGAVSKYVFGCDVGKGFDISKYDEDGWEKQVLDKLPGLKALYMPAKGVVLSNLDSALGSNVAVFTFDEINNPINQSALNVGTPKLNISRMDFIEGQLDASEAAMTTAEIAQAFYNGQKNTFESKAAYKSTCAIAEPQIKEETYGNNTFTNLNFITVCLNSGSENVWALSKYSFMKMPGDKILMVSIGVADDVKAKGTDTTDSAKLPSKEFIAQLYSKIQVK